MITTERNPGGRWRHSRLVCWVSLVSFLLLALPAHAQVDGGDDPVAPWAPGGPSRAEDLRAFLYTFGPGDEIVSWWGHTALVVEDIRLRQARLYNYGMFSFDNAMLLKFAKGRLEFWVGEAPVSWTVHFYAAGNRAVQVQELNLKPESAQRLAQKLAVNVQPAHRDYLYDHYKDNCSTRPRDVIDDAIGGQLKRATAGPGRMTLRQHTQRYTAVNPPMSVFLDFMMNDSIDQPITQQQEAFLPDELEHQLDALRYVNPEGVTLPLVLRSVPLTHPHREPVRTQPPRYGGWLVAVGAGIALLGLLAQRVGRKAFGFYQLLIGLLVGLPGTVLLIMWAFTNHTVTYHNENLTLASPFTLMLLPLAVGVMRGKQKAIQRSVRLWYGLLGLALLGLLLKLLPAFDQDNRRALALLLPILLGGAVAGFMIQRRDTWQRT